MTRFTPLGQPPSFGRWQIVGLMGSSGKQVKDPTLAVEQPSDKLSQSAHGGEDR